VKLGTLNTADIISCLSMYGISVFFIVESTGLPDASAAFPQAVAWILVGLTTLYIVKGLLGKTKEERKREETVARKFVLTAAASVAYVAMIQVTGYLLTTVVFLVGLFWALGYRRRFMAVIIALTVVIVVYAGFRLALGVPLPTGILGGFSG
jgi:putative tricarboxylic transport membrane protein